MAFLAHLSRCSGWAIRIVDCPASVVRRPSCVNIFSVYALEATILIGSASNLHRMFVLMISWSSSNMGQVGPISRSPGQKVGQSLMILVYALEAIFFAQLSSNFVRMFMLMISRTSSNMGQVGSKSRSLGQIIEKPGLRTRGYIFCPIFLKTIQNVCLCDILVKFEYGSD